MTDRIAGPVLTRESRPGFWEADGLTLARSLLGLTLVRRTAEGECAVLISETEAYMGVIDRASHAYGGRRTARTETMYLPGGFAYVYLIYGLYSCANVTAGREGCAEAVLLRAAEPLDGKGILLANLRRASRAKKSVFPDSPDGWSAEEWRRRLNGPGRLCAAMGISREQNGLDLAAEGELFFRDDGFRPTGMTASPRIGIDYAGEDRDRPWRFTADGFGPDVSF